MKYLKVIIALSLFAFVVFEAIIVANKVYSVIQISINF